MIVVVMVVMLLSTLTTLMTMMVCGNDADNDDIAHFENDVVMMVVVVMLKLVVSTLTTLSSSKGGAARACQDCSVPAAAMWPNLQKMVFVCAKKEHFTTSVNVNFLSSYIFMYSFNAFPLFQSN